jgi:Rieske Fe-S protein
MRRSQFIISAGIGLGAVVLAACTTYGKKPEASGDTPSTMTNPPRTGGTAPEPANIITKTADVPVGSGVIVGEIVVTQAAAGDFKGFSSTCPHAGCSVNEVADGTIICPCHGSKFNLDGSVAQGPATKPLTSKAVRVQGDSVILG